MGDPKRIDVLDRAGLAVAGDDVHPDLVARRIGERLLSAARLAGLVVAVAAGVFGGELGPGFWPIAATLLVGQLLLTARSFSPHGDRTPHAIAPALALTGLAGLAVASGGAQSPVLGALAVFPAIGALVLGRGRILVSASLLLLGVLGASLPDVLEGEPAAGRLLVVHVLTLAFATTTGLVMTAGRMHLRDRLARLHDQRRLLLVDLLTAAATERRRVSGTLGAGPLQLLLAARQDLQEMANGDAPDDARARCSVALREAAARLRGTVVDLRAPRPAPPMPDDDGFSDAQIAVRLLAYLRIAAVPALAVATVLGDPDRSPGLGVVLLLAAIAASQAVAVAVSLSPAWERLPVRRLAYVDMAAVGILVAVSGGAQSPALAPATVLPLVSLLVGTPREQLHVVAVLAVSLLAACVPDVVEDEPQAASMLAVGMLTLAWTTTTAYVAALGRRRLDRRTAQLEGARRTLLRDSVAVQDAERAAIARALHDDALQLVLAAVQELESDDDAQSLRPVRVALSHVEQAAGSLREGADALHPSALEHGGLAPALRDTTLRALRTAATSPAVTVGDGIDARHHELVVGLTRELVTNVAKHAHATRVSVNVAPDGAGVTLEVADDGTGMTPERPEQALADGHVGLASCRERVEAAGGTLDLRSRPGAGTTVRVRLP